MKKIITATAAGILAAGMLFAGGSKDSATTGKAKTINADTLKNAKITLELWHAQTGTNEKALDKVVDLFNSTNEYGITVNATSQGGYTDCHKKVTAALAAGKQPNLAQAYNNNILTYLESGKVLNLTNYLNDSFGLTAKDKETIVKGYWDENKAYPDGNIYSTSLGKSAEVLFYNKTFFEKNNLKVPTTFDELADVSAKASKILGKPALGWDSPENLAIYGPQNYGAKYADVNGKVFLFDKDNIDKTVKFYQYWQKGIKEGYFRIAGEDKYCSGPFSSGQMVMFVGSCSGANYITPDGFEVAAAPAPVGKHPVVIQQGGNFCGFSSGDAATDLATSIFLEFLYTPQASAVYAANTGYAPSNTAAENEQIYKDCIASNSINAQAKNVAANYPGDYLGFDPVFASSYAVRTEIGKIIETISLDPNADIMDAIKTAENSLK